MIRNDYLNKFIGYDIYNAKFGSPKLKVKWHYVIVDIKHSHIILSADTKHILNSREEQVKETIRRKIIKM
jgi:hypothetical protein